jgi:large subunit ribosomal protein L25
VAVVIVGRSVAVDTYGGILLQVMNELTIEALPQALVPHIEVNISSIAQIGQSISVGDITPPPGVTILNDANEVIVQVTKQEAEEIEAPKPAAEAVAAAAATPAETKAAPAA